jgi:hypothetical protein
VRSTGIVRSEHAPFRIVPHRGQVTEHSIKSSKSEGWRVFHEDESRSNLANDPRHVSPHAGSLSVDSSAFACDADVLARESSRHHVNTASPWSSVKGLHVIPNRERREKSVILPCDEYACGVGVPLDGAHGSPSEQVPAEYASTSARE